MRPGLLSEVSTEFAFSYRQSDHKLAYSAFRDWAMPRFLAHC